MGNIHNIQRIEGIYKTSTATVSDYEYYDNIIFENKLESFIIGSNATSFKGFLWTFQVFNSKMPNDMNPLVCNSGTSSSCLLSCDLNQYFSTSCNTCSNCTSGCMRAGSCELCSDPLCFSCLDYQTPCLTCKANSISISDTCKCLVGFYFNQSTNTCDKCSSNCIACTSLNDCICPENSHAENQTCVCNSHFWRDSNLNCSICHSYCLDCSNSTFYRCLSCSNYLLGSVCVNQCPYGYVEDSVKKICDDGGGGISAKFGFDRLDCNFTVNDLEIKCGDMGKFYPYFDNFDPWPAYKRGIYFSDKKFCKISSQKYLLGLRFGLSIWMNPYDYGGVVFSLIESNQILLSVKVTSTSIELGVMLQSFITLSFPQIADLKTWTFLTINFEYKTDTLIEVGVNKILSNLTLIDEFPFNSSSSSIFYLSSQDTTLSSFTGFVYELSIYKSPLSLSWVEKYLNSTLPLPNCDILTFPQDLSCVPCQDSCIFGCRSMDSCNLCEDVNCLYCSDYEQGSCATCNQNFEFKNGVCAELCKSKQYSDGVYCQNCSDYCLSCKSSEKCLKCMNKYLLFEGFCYEICGKFEYFGE